MPKTSPFPSDDRFLDAPIAWFGELLLARDRGDFRRAADAERELARLGWTVRYRKSRPEADGREGGR